MFKALSGDRSNLTVEVYPFSQKPGSRGYPVFHLPGRATYHAEITSPGQHFVHNIEETHSKATLSQTHPISRVNGYPVVRQVPGYPPKIAESTREYPGGFLPYLASISICWPRVLGGVDLGRLRSTLLYPAPRFPKGNNLLGVRVTI